jgi:hypothetical protein
LKQDFLSEKIELVKAISERLFQRKAALEREILDMEKARDTNTKSTAGDKHETGRAMAQNEIEQLSKQLIKIRKDYSFFQQLDLRRRLPEVALGAYVKTSTKNFFIGPALGKIEFNNDEVYCISPASPVGAQLLGLKKSQHFQFGNAEEEIQNLA